MMSEYMSRVFNPVEALPNITSLALALPPGAQNG